MNKTFRENLTQFVTAVVIGWLIMYLVPAKLFYEVYIPFSFLWLFWLINLAIIGRGWPITPPEGFWKPGMSKVGAGFLMTVLSLVLALGSTLFLKNIWPTIPLFPVAIYFGALLFGTTLWYAFTWGAYPVAKKTGALNLLVSIIVIPAIASILWLTLVNFQGTPFANASFDPHGMFQADFVLGLAIWTIVWIMIFSNSMQGYPFYKLAEPLDKIMQTIASVVLGYLCWTISIKFMNPGFSFAAVGASIISWVLYHTAFFEFYPNESYIQPKRGIYNLLVIGVLAAVWIPILRIILVPIVAKAAAAGIPFDISAVGMLFSLHIVAVLLTVHNAFWFKMPFAPANPPLGPEEIPDHIPVEVNTLSQSKLDINEAG